MRILTSKFIESATAPEGKRLVESDQKVAGLMFRVTDKGAKSFSFRYRLPGARDQITLTIGSIEDVDLAKARRLAESYRKMLVDGKDPREHAPKEIRRREERDAITFETVADRYIEEYAKPNKDSWKNDQGYLARAKEWFVDRAIHGITDDELADFLDDVAAEAPVSANRTQSVLHTMFKWAKQPGRKYVTVNPLADMDRRGGKEESRTRVLSDDEIRTLWHGLDRLECPGRRQTGLALKMILATMVRPGQAASALRSGFRDMSGESPQWHLLTEQVKKRREVIVPLNDLAVWVFEDTLESDKQKVLFPATRREVGNPIARSTLSHALNDRETEDRIGIRTFLKMDHFTPHDLRRTAATIARRAGAQRADVKAMLDHINGDVTAVYDKYDMLKEKREVARILGEELQRIIGV